MLWGGMESSSGFISMILKFNVEVDLSQYMKVYRFSKKNKHILLTTAANRYLNYLRRRFIANSAGGGQWAQLKHPDTIDRKTRRGIADNPEAILREYDVLLNSMGTKVISGKTYVGYVRNTRHPRGLMIFKLVSLHARGEGHLPVRQAIGLPNRVTGKRMAEDVRDQYNKVIRRAKRG